MRYAITEAMLLDDIEALKAPRRIRRRSTHQLVQELPISRSMLARTWQFSQRNGVSWEVVLIDRPSGWGEELIDRLNRDGMHAIARDLSYADYQEFARDLAYRSYLAGVVDAPERRLVYGSRYVDPGQVA